MRVKIYTKDMCPYCVKAKEWFDGYGIKYTLIDLTNDEKRHAYYTKHGASSVPQIIIDGQHIGGYSDLLTVGPTLVPKKKKKLLKMTDERPYFKPFHYPWAYDAWLKHEQSHWLHCVAGDQRVNTSLGLLTAEYIHNSINMDNVNLFDNNNKITSSQMINTGFRQTVKVHTKEGYTHTVTPDHRIMTNRGWVEVQNLVEGEHINIQTNEGCFGSIQSPERAYLYGHFQGDGTLGDGIPIWQLWEHDYSLIDKIEQCVQHCLQQESNNKIEQYGEPKFRREIKDAHNNNVGSRRLSTSRLGTFVKNVVPEFVWMGTKETVIEYITGLLHTDGTAYVSPKGHQSIKLSQTNQQFLSSVQLLLLSLGIKSSCYKRDSGEQLLPDGNGGQKYFQTANLYTIEITSASAVSLLNEYTDIFKFKHIEYRQPHLNKSHPISTARFSHLEDMGEQDVYCVSVNTTDKLWICNGFQTHNTEIPLNEDLKDWDSKLSGDEKYFLTQIFRFFTQADIDVAGGYVNNYLPYFPQPEIRMMLTGFAAREALHVAAYSHLIESLGMSESTYNEFLDFEAMREKHEYFDNVVNATDMTLPVQIAAISAFTEGLALFSSFIMLLNFPRHGKMKGMGQIVTWSIVDEAVIKGTEVLTPVGWAPIETLTIGDTILQYDMATKQTSFVATEKIQHVTRDITYHFNNNDIDQQVSPNHRMILNETDGTVGESTAEQIFDSAQPFSLILSGNKKGKLTALTEKHKQSCIMSATGDINLQWVVPILDDISSDWCEEFLELYTKYM
jgi:ribonucleotide reductase beta subunit family protein with ferritin-like domain/glutaredoxin